MIDMIIDFYTNHTTDAILETLLYVIALIGITGFIIFAEIRYLKPMKKRDEKKNQVYKYWIMRLVFTVFYVALYASVTRFFLMIIKDKIIQTIGTSIDGGVWN